MSHSPLPEAFTAAIRKRLGEEADAFLRMCDEPPVRALRLDPCKPLPGEILSILSCDPPHGGDPVPWAEGAYFIGPDCAAGSHPLHEAGAFYIQEPSAMVPAAVLDARPGERVLDLCAAPGGKTTQLAASMRDAGLLVANEPVAERARVLSRNIERMGMTNTLVVSAWPHELADRFPGAFDAVLADAPCSGEGMFRRVPEARLEWTPDTPARCAARQAEILDAAARMVRKGGRMVYATCTLNTLENEDTVRAFLQRHPDFSLKAFSLPCVDAPEGMWTAWLHRFRGEGQFCALLVRAGGEPLPVWQRKGLTDPPRDAVRQMREIFPEAPEPTGMLEETLVCLPDLPDVRGLRILRCGLHLGETRGKVFRPDHAWAVSAKPPAVPRIPVDTGDALRYQAGETLVCGADTKGWLMPTLRGLPLGWGKAAGGLIKNHYPKGLRRPLRT